MSQQPLAAPALVSPEEGPGPLGQTEAMFTG